MLDIQSLVNGLMNSDDKHAYECLKQLEDESKRCSNVYPFFETFAEMLDSTNSYIRTRGIILIAANAKWD
ncbi:MAG: SufBD protein, partial [Angelakisella sp.]